MIGSGSRFLSGISYYTHRLGVALADRHRVSIVLIRRLLPKRFYPGRDRVGAELVSFDYPDDVEVYDGIDWFAIPSLFGALRFIRRQRPEVLIMQWWTGTVLHSYLVIALFARLRRIRIVIEFHEILDTAELGIPPVRWYVKALAPVLMRLADGYAVHSEFDRDALAATYPLRGPVELIPHGPYDRYADPTALGFPPVARPQEKLDGESPCRILYFGVIRPFKGVEDLIAAFDGLSSQDAARFRLTIVGETWEGWTLPGEMIERSPHREQIDFVNKYVTDEEVQGHFAASDAVVLPYHRSSASGPLHLAMAHGLPVVVTSVGGLIEATEGYQGALRVPAQDPDAIRKALVERVLLLRGSRFEDVHSWERTTERFGRLLEEVLG